MLFIWIIGIIDIIRVFLDNLDHHDDDWNNLDDYDHDDDDWNNWND